MYLIFTLIYLYIHIRLNYHLVYQSINIIIFKYTFIINNNLIRLEIVEELSEIRQIKIFIV